MVNDRIGVITVFWAVYLEEFYHLLVSLKEYLRVKIRDPVGRSRFEALPVGFDSMSCGLRVEFCDFLDGCHGTSSGIVKSLAARLDDQNGVLLCFDQSALRKFLNLLGGLGGVSSGLIELLTSSLTSEIAASFSASQTLLSCSISSIF